MVTSNGPTVLRKGQTFKRTSQLQEIDQFGGGERVEDVSELVS